MSRSRLPSIAIVGRPNVGKSSLLNRLAGRRISIVDPTPGVTRDRVAAEIEIHPPSETPRGTPALECEVIDTGGYGVYTAEGRRFDDVGADLSRLTGDIERQIGAAIASADVILFVSDAQEGVTALDRDIARLLRQRGAADKVLPVANKVDDETWLGHAAEASGLGFGDAIGVSAGNAHNIRQLTEVLWDRLQTRSLELEAEREEGGKRSEIRMSIVGKRNSGKSTLINAWAGEDRVIVSEIAGTTRDSVDVRMELDGRAVIAIDTAGLRKRKSFADDIEFYAHTRMIDAITRSDVALLLLDASAEVSQVDQKLAQELVEQYKPTVIVVNKWDLAEQKGLTPEDYAEYLTQQLRGLEFAPVAFISARDKTGLGDLLSIVFSLHEQASHRETTGKLNDAIGEIMKQRGPSSKGGARARVYFASQVAKNPPTIVLSVNKPDLFHGQYERYLVNELRERLPFAEVPIKLLFRARERISLEELKKRKPRDEGAEPRPERPERSERATAPKRGRQSKVSGKRSGGPSAQRNKSVKSRRSPPRRGRRR